MQEDRATAPPEPVPVEPGTHAAKRAILRGSIVIVIGVLATTLSQPQSLALIPIRNLLKNELHVDRAVNAAFFFWIGLAWYFKPFAGVLTDAFPLFGSRRRSYIIISSTAATLFWVVLYFTPHQYRPLLWVCALMSVFMVIASTVVGGYMVELGQATAASGRVTAVRQFVYWMCILVSGPAGGYLASKPLSWTMLASGIIMFLLVPTTILFLHEKRVEVDSHELLDAARKQMVKIATARTMWAAVGLLALFYVAPGLTTALFYKQQNDLHLNTEAQGYLQFLSGVFGAVAAVGYGFLCRRFNLRTMLLWCIAAGTAANLGYLFYTSYGRAQVIDSFNGFGYALAEIALMDLAVRATPAGSEGLGFSLMMSVRNLALFGTDWFGSNLIDNYHIHFNTLVLANGGTTLLALPLVLFLPKILVSKKDAE